MMATTKKVLGQVFPSPSTVTELYATGENTEVVFSTIFCCNQNTEVADTFSIAVRPTADSLDTKHIIYFHEPLPALRTYAITCGITLGANYTIEVTSINGTTSFSGFGQETTA